MSTGNPIPDCSGRQCGYAAFDGELGCTNGGNYFFAEMLRAKESNFHDELLVEATHQINRILADIKERSNDDKLLAFLHTPFGTMLAWIRHDLEIPDDAVTEDSCREDLIEALGLIDPPMREEKEKAS